MWSCVWHVLSTVEGVELWDGVLLSVGLDDVGAPYISFTASGWLDPLGICIRTTGLVPQLEASVGVWTQCFFRMRLLFGSKVMICFSGGA